MARRYEFYVLVAKTISHSFALLTREIVFLPLEHKIHIFSPPCNILYILRLFSFKLEIICTCVFFKKLKIHLILFEKPTRANYFQIERQVVWLPIRTYTSESFGSVRKSSESFGIYLEPFLTHFCKFQKFSENLRKASEVFGNPRKASEII